MEEEEEQHPHFHKEEDATFDGDSSAFDIIRKEKLQPDEDNNKKMEEDKHQQAEENQVVEVEATTIIQLQSKLKDLLKGLCSMEVSIYSKASKDFVRLLKGENGGDYLRHYVQSSAKCIELMEAWKLRQGKPGMVHVFSLVSMMLDHPIGRSRASGNIFRNLDHFARLIFSERLEDVYVELKSEDPKRQSAALHLLASIVRRGMSLASEVASKFDFKLPMLPKLSGIRKMKAGKDARKQSTRKSFIEFAMSFLEVGNPRLLRWILQQRALYFGVLQGLGSDDSKTVLYVLSILRDKVLIVGSLLPPGLRSVLFGIVTLEQLSLVSGNPEGGPAADMAHEILLMVCTDPCNGLMPDSNSKGNPTRLLELMKKLKATEAKYHKNLLLAIVKGKPSLCSLYMEVFPYNLEPCASPLWFSAILLAADLISSANSSSTFNLVTSLLSQDLPDLDSYEMQCILKCILPRSFTRSVSNKGLLHSNILVKHGSLRLLLEMLKSLHNLLVAIDRLAEKRSLDKLGASDNTLVELNGVPGLEFFGFIESHIDPDSGSASQSDQSVMLKWASLKEDIQDKVRTMLPDPQVLFNLLVSSQKLFKPFSSVNCKSSGGSAVSLKRPGDLDKLSHKRLKPNTNSIDDNIDIVISGINLETNNNKADDNGKGNIAEEKGSEKTYIATTVDEIWGSCEAETVSDEAKDVDAFFYMKLLDALAYYMRTIPRAMDGSFDFFKTLCSEPSSLSFCQQNSLLSLLVECIGQSPGGKGSVRAPDMMYKYLQPLINILIYSQEENQHEAYTLARSAMISTGAFNHNLSEIDVWFLFLPGHKKDKYFAETEGGKMYGDFSAVVSFLCDAVSTMGNNLYKNLYHMHCLISQLGSLGENSFNFSPLVVIIIQKCLRLLESDSGNFNLPDKTMISLYVSNTLSLLLQSQAELGSLPGLINLLLSEKFNGPFSVSEDSNGTQCEWRPLKKLLLFAQSIVNQQTCDSLFCMPVRVIKGNGGSLYKVLSKVKEFLENKLDTGLVGVAISLSSSIICASPNDIIDCFPLLVFVAQRLFEAQTQCLLLVLSLEWNILPVVSDLWPDLFFSALDIVGGMLSNSHEHNDGHFLSKKKANSTASLRPVSTNHRDSSESTVTAFRFFLERASFYSIFTSIFSLSSFNVSLSTKLLDLLLAKVSAGGLRDSILSLRVVLFWAHQIRSSYKVKPSDDLERLLQMCFVLIEHILEHLLAAKNGTAILERVGTHCQVDCVLEVAELIILHPLVNQSLSNPLCSDSLVKEILYDDLGDIIVLSKRSLHPIDHSILRIFNRVADFLIAFRGIWKATPTTSVSASVVEAFKKISQYCLDSFREKFSLSITSKDLVPLLPSFCILHGLMRFISPSDLLALVHWMLSRVDHHVIGLKSQGVHVLSVALCIADGAFKVLSGVLHQRNRGCLLFWESTGRTYSTCLLQNVFFKILDFSARFSLDLADRCLLSAVDTVYGLRFSRPTAAVLPFNMLMLKIIISSPVEILTHCIYNISKTKARLLFNLTEISSLHSRLFGMIFFDIICKEPSSNLGDKLSLKGAVAMNKCNYAFANEDFVLLLPAALSFLTNNILKFRGCNHETCLNIPAFYSRILLDSFSNWKEYVSMDIFHEDCDELTSKQENFHSAFHSTLLGKAVRMLQYFFTLSQDSVKRKQQLKYFDSIYESNELLSTVDVLKTKAQSYGETFNFVNKVIAKISFTWLLLFYQENQFHDFSMEVDGDSKVASIRKESKREKCAKLKFMDILVSALHKIVKNTSSKLDPHEESNSACWFQLLRFLEVSIINSILRLATKINSFVTLSTSTPFLESFIKSSLSHRFDDPFTLKAIQNILTTFKGGLPTGEVLELVLGHSKFVSIILSGDSFHTSYSLAQTGTFLQTAPSIFELVASPSIQRPLDFKHALFDLRNRESCPDNIKLELVKLLRFLYHHVVPQNEMGVDSMNSRELLSLLLSGYGASLHETDLEIFQLLLEIESIEKSSTSSIADMDYLWGCSALKIRKEQTIDRLVNDNQATDCETVQDKSRRLFRENILINSKTCALTVLNFCYERSKLMSCKYLEGPSQYDILDVPHADNSQQSRLANLYDPSFILRFSINSLLKGYIGPIEFTRLGLLAIALVSISSLDADVRTLGYEALGSFQKALMDHKKNKDVLQLQLLLTYLQNGITEPWQRIPSICAIFAAEASFILLDTSHDHFQTISKFLMRSPKMGLKDIPLFHAFFDSSSIKFETEHLWILRLIYAGLNIDDDAQILMSKFVIEILLSFYDSSLSNTETKVVILQILKKSVKLHMLACRLVMSSGLLSWLYSVMLYCGERLCGDQKDISMRQLEIILEVILDVVSIRTISEWLKNAALEQLCKISSYLRKLIVDSLGLLKESISLVNSIFRVISSTLRFSQKRKVYQPHFTMSLEGIFQLSHVIDKELGHMSSSLTTELGLATLLMSTPPTVRFCMDKAKLAKVVLQAIPFALQSSCENVRVPKESDSGMLKSSGGWAKKESLLEKLLRWINASIILGFIPTRCSGTNVSFQRSVVENLQSLLDSIQKRNNEYDRSMEEDHSSNFALAAMILHLQLLHQANTTNLPSVILALRLLLFPNDIHNTAVQEFLDGSPNSHLLSLCSKIRCPAEVNPAWRWSFHEPWRNKSIEQTSIQMVEEEHACQVLLFALSNSLVGDSSASPVLSEKDFERLFLWERKNVFGGG